MDGIILFSDDHIYTAGRPEAALFESLRVEMPVLGVDKLELAAEAVKSIASFRALILDWQYSDSGDEGFDDLREELGEGVAIQRPAARDDQAMEFLKDNDFYSLVYIFSELDIEESHGEALRLKFGDRVRIRRKDENFTIDGIANVKASILDDINTWREGNTNLAVPIMWSSSINEAIQKIFKELSAANVNWLRELYDSAARDGVDPVLFVIELLQLLLSEAVVQDRELFDAISGIGNADVTPVPENQMDDHRKSLSKLFSRLYYSELKDTSPVMTGDIFELDQDQYGVLVTPECDVKFILSNEGSDFEYLTFTSAGFDEMLQRDKTITKAQYTGLAENKRSKIRQIFNQEQPRLHIFPSLPLLGDNCQNSCVIDFRISHKRMLAAELIKRPRKYKVNSPFIQQLRQRYLSHIGRVGTAALPDHVRDWNLLG